MEYKMKQIFVLVFLACICTAEKPENQNKEKRGISAVHISSPYSQVRYGPEYPLYGEQHASTYHGGYFPYGGYNGYNPYYPYPGYPSYQPPVYVPQPPAQPPVFVPEQPPVLVPGHPECEEKEPPEEPETPIPPKPDRPPIHPPVHPPDEPQTQPPVQPPVYPPAHPPVRPPPQPPAYPPVMPPSHPPMQPPVYPPAYPPVKPPSHPPMQPPAYPPAQPPVYPPPHPPVQPPSPPAQPPVYPPPHPPVQPPSPPAYPPAQPPVYLPPHPPVQPPSPPAYPPAQPPVYPPAHPPVQPPPQPPAQPPAYPPVKPPSHPPMQPPVYPPPHPPVQPPAQPPVQPPVYPPAYPPIYPPIYPPVQPPAFPPIGPPDCPPGQPPIYPPIQNPPPIYEDTPPEIPPSYDYPTRPIVPPYQHRPATRPPLAVPAHSDNAPTVSTSHSPMEVHVTVKNVPGHTVISERPTTPRPTSIPSSPPSATPPTHLPEIPQRNHPIGPREDPTPRPRVPYQPPTPSYIPQFDTGPQFFPPQDIYVTQAPYPPQYYPYYPQYPAQQPTAPTNTRNIQTVSHPADSFGRQRTYTGDSKPSNQGFSGIPAHNNGQFLIETTQRSSANKDAMNYGTTQASNNDYDDTTPSPRPIYNRNEGHYVTVKPNNYKQQQQQPERSSPTTTSKFSRFEVRRPAIQKQVYDIEEKVIVRPVGSATLELVEEDTSNVMKIRHGNQGSPDRNGTKRIIGMKHDQGTNDFGSGINTQSNSVALNQRRGNNARSDTSSQRGEGGSGVVYADQDMPVHFRDTSDLKTPKHILSPFAAQVQRNMTKDDVPNGDPNNSHTKAYLYGKNMIKDANPCPPSKTVDYDDYSEDYNNGVNVSPNGDYGLRSNTNANIVDATTQQNTGYTANKNQDKSGIDANNRIQGRLLSVMPIQEASTGTEVPTEHSSMRRIIVSRPVETVQIVEVPEYKQSQNQRLISGNNDANNQNETSTPARIIYSNQKVETQTVQYHK